jgi:hypothetical protein
MLLIRLQVESKESYPTLKQHMQSWIILKLFTGQSLKQHILLWSMQLFLGRKYLYVENAVESKSPYSLVVLVSLGLYLLHLAPQLHLPRVSLIRCYGFVNINILISCIVIIKKFFLLRRMIYSNFILIDAFLWLSRSLLLHRLFKWWCLSILR